MAMAPLVMDTIRVGTSYTKTIFIVVGLVYTYDRPGNLFDVIICHLRRDKTRIHGGLEEGAFATVSYTVRQTQQALAAKECPKMARSLRTSRHAYSPSLTYCS